MRGHGAFVIGRMVLAGSLAGFAAVTPGVRAADSPMGPQPGGLRAPEDPGTATPGAPSSIPRHDGRRTMRRFVSNLGRGAIGVFDDDNVPALVIGGIATGAAMSVDDEVRLALNARNAWGRRFQTAGGPIYTSLFVTGMFAAGRLSGGVRFRAMTYDMLEATMVNLAYTAILKETARRKRPGSQDHRSFPSGHTSSAFAMASVAERHCGWRIGLPAYVLAGFMGASRLDQDKHWLSDVVAGAALGYVVGRAVVRVNDRPLDPGERQPSWSVYPIVEGHARGVRVSVVF